MAVRRKTPRFRLYDVFGEKGRIYPHRCHLSSCGLILDETGVYAKQKKVARCRMQMTAPLRCTPEQEKEDGESSSSFVGLPACGERSPRLQSWEVHDSYKRKKSPTGSAIPKKVPSSNEHVPNGRCQRFDRNLTSELSPFPDDVPDAQEDRGRMPSCEFLPS